MPGAGELYLSQELENAGWNTSGTRTTAVRVLNDVGGHGARVRCVMFGKDLNDNAGPETLATGDQIRLARLPSNARLVYITDADSDSAIIHIGLRHAPSGDQVDLVGGTLGVDYCVDTIAKNIDGSEDQENLVLRFHCFPDMASGNLAYAGHPLWKYTGATFDDVTEDTGVDYYINITMGVVANGVETNVAFGAVILYTID